MSENTIDIEQYLKEQSPLIDKEIEKVIPKTIDAAWLDLTFGKARYAYDMDSIQRCLVDPVWDLLGRGGKRWRPVLMQLCCEAVGGNPQSFREYLALPEVIHNGTLMIDDIEDSSELRRGKPCTHKLFGVDIAINAGNFMYFVGYGHILRDGNLSTKQKMKLYELINQEMTNIHVGQGMDILWHRGQKYDVTEDAYLQMCAYKTGTLARVATRMGAILGEGKKNQIEALGKFGESIGVAFQIQDDILNLVGEKMAKGKGVGEDIHEGKRTIMVLHALDKADAADKKRLLDILNVHPSDEPTILEAIAIIQKYKGIEYGAKRAKELVEKSWKGVEKALPPSHAKEVLHAFAQFLINRDI